MFLLFNGDLSRLKIKEMNDPLNVKNVIESVYDSRFFNKLFIADLLGEQDNFQIKAVKWKSLMDDQLNCICGVCENEKKKTIENFV